MTLIASDGQILYDSAVEAHSMENHRDRPEIADALVHGFGETVRLSQTLDTQCENGIKYNRENGRVIVSVSGGDKSVVLKVVDTGIGIPTEHQCRVFERFYRVDDSRSKTTGGTGLGLSIVKRGAICHNATIELDSEPGVGTTVTIRFPVDKYLVAN